MNSAALPDIVVKPDSLTGRPFSPDPIAVIELLSRSNTKADRRWRLNAYAATGSIQHYLTVEQARVDGARWRSEPQSRSRRPDA